MCTQNCTGSTRNWYGFAGFSFENALMEQVFGGWYCSPFHIEYRDGALLMQVSQMLLKTINYEPEKSASGPYVGSSNVQVEACHFLTKIST